MSVFNQRKMAPGLPLHELKPDYNIQEDEQLKVFKKKRIPGKLRMSMQSSLTNSVESLEVLSSRRQKQSNDIYEEMEEIINSLLFKNQNLIAVNLTLKKQNRELSAKVSQYQQQINTLLSYHVSNNNPSQLMNYFNNIGNIPILQSIESLNYNIEGSLCMVKQDNNSNIRAFYLSMLQTHQTRQLLRQLVADYENDESWKLVPLLSTNQSWVNLSNNFFKILDSTQFTDLQQIYSFINQSQLYDIIFISAIRSRIQFLSQGYDSQIPTLQLYSAICNIFARQQIQLQLKQTISYDQYCFYIGQFSFALYFLQDINRFGVTFYKAQNIYQLSKLYQIQSNNISTPLSTSRTKIKGLFSQSQPSSIIKRKRLISQRYCQQKNQRQMI